MIFIADKFPQRDEQTPPHVFAGVVLFQVMVLCPSDAGELASGTTKLGCIVNSAFS